MSITPALGAQISWGLAAMADAVAGGRNRMAQSLMQSASAQAMQAQLNEQAKKARKEEKKASKGKLFSSGLGAAGSVLGSMIPGVGPVVGPMLGQAVGQYAGGKLAGVDNNQIMNSLASTLPSAGLSVASNIASSAGQVDTTKTGFDIVGKNVENLSQPSVAPITPPTPEGKYGLTPSLHRQQKAIPEQRQAGGIKTSDQVAYAQGQADAANEQGQNKVAGVIGDILSQMNELYSMGGFEPSYTPPELPLAMGMAPDQVLSINQIAQDQANARYGRAQDSREMAQRERMFNTQIGESQADREQRAQLQSEELGFRGAEGEADRGMQDTISKRNLAANMARERANEAFQLGRDRREEEFRREQAELGRGHDITLRNTPPAQTAEEKAYMEAQTKRTEAETRKTQADIKARKRGVITTPSQEREISRAIANASRKETNEGIPFEEAIQSELTRIRPLIGENLYEYYSNQYNALRPAEEAPQPQVSGIPTTPITDDKGNTFQVYKGPSATPSVSSSQTVAPPPKPTPSPAPSKPKTEAPSKPSEPGPIGTYFRNYGKALKDLGEGFGYLINPFSHNLTEEELEEFRNRNR